MPVFMWELWLCAASSDVLIEEIESVPNWKQLLIGDAFRLPSRDLNYYRDAFLIWPFLLFTIAGLTSLFSHGHDPRLVFSFAGLSLLSVLLARERLILICGALGFCFVQSLLSFSLKHEWMGLVVAVAAGALLLVLAPFLKNEPSYGWPKGLSIADVLVSLLSLGFSIAMVRWIGR
jgi:hypothetical protein